MSDERKLKIKNAYLKLIANTVYDYDGFDNVVDLKSLVDDIYRYCILALDNDDLEPIYIIDDNTYENILCERIEKGEK